MSNQSKVLKINASFNFWMNELYSEITLEVGYVSWKFHTVFKNIDDYIPGKCIAWFKFFILMIFSLNF